jgi:hypothetical protein
MGLLRALVAMTGLAAAAATSACHRSFPRECESLRAGVPFSEADARLRATGKVHVDSGPAGTRYEYTSPNGKSMFGVGFCNLEVDASSHRVLSAHYSED